MHELRVSGSESRLLAFDHNGKRIAVTTGREAGRIHLFDASSGNEIGVIAAPPIGPPPSPFHPTDRFWPQA